MVKGEGGAIMIEKFWIWLAWKLPRPLAKWAYIRVATAASVEMSDREMGAIKCIEALEAWK